MRLVILEPGAPFAALREQLIALGPYGGERLLILTTPGEALTHRDSFLILLRRLADREHLDVGLVSDDAGLRRQAAALGLPAFPDIDSAERQERAWHPTHRREQIGFGPGESRRPSDVA